MVKSIPVKELRGGVKRAELERGVSGPETHRNVPKAGDSELYDLTFFVYSHLLVFV